MIEPASFLFGIAAGIAISLVGFLLNMRLGRLREQQLIDDVNDALRRQPPRTSGVMWN